MSRRDHADRRCPRCHLHRALCLCAEVTSTPTTHRLLLVVHKSEAQKPTTTGNLATLVLPHSATVVVDGKGGPAVDHSVGVDADDAVLLFPADDAVPLQDVVATRTRPLTLVVPDGTWAEAQKMRRRVPGLAGLRCVSLPPGPPTTYRLRSEPKDGGLATLEAIARAFAILEGERGAAVKAALLSTFERFVERTLWMRGALRDDELRYGLPDAARRVSPRGGHEG
jgi:DTW domain-containing protein YfiP